jgi:hypothetical protein
MTEYINYISSSVEGECVQALGVLPKSAMAMDLLFQSCKDSSEYPQNLVYHDALSYNLRMYCSRLSEQGSRLFNKSRADIDFLDLDVGHKGKLLQFAVGQVADKTGIGQNFVQAV